MQFNEDGEAFFADIAAALRLQAAIEAMPASNHLTFLVTGEGNPFTAAGVGNWFRDRCCEAKLPARCTSHGLRKAAATYLAELGATEHQLMAWFGWVIDFASADIYEGGEGEGVGASRWQAHSGNRNWLTNQPGEPKWRSRR